MADAQSHELTRSSGTKPSLDEPLARDVLKYSPASSVSPEARCRFVQPKEQGVGPDQPLFDC